MPNPPPTSDMLRVEAEKRGRAAVVKLTGSANMEAAADLQDQLIDLIDEGPDRLILELGDLNFICSVGLGAIIAAHLHSRHHHSEVVLVKPQQAILELLELTRLTKLFPIYDSVDAALAAR